MYQSGFCALRHDSLALFADLCFPRAADHGAFNNFDARRGPKVSGFAHSLTVGVGQRKSKLQKEYADRAFFNHKPVNGLGSQSEKIPGIIFQE